MYVGVTWVYRGELGVRECEMDVSVGELWGATGI